MKLKQPKHETKTARRAHLLAELRSWHGDTDLQIAHGAADKALLAYIDDPEVTEAFESIERWYA